MASSITQAREGSLYLMCGGKEEVFNRVKPILEKLSASLRYIGGAPTRRRQKFVAAEVTRRKRCKGDRLLTSIIY
jgi:3-hydroxyisobutyrate dehydrogenase-like beta-hydroxyacid dehydrogenase